MNRRKFASGKPVVRLRFENKMDTEEAMRNYIASLPENERAEIVTQLLQPRAEIVKQLLQSMGGKNPRSEKEILKDVILKYQLDILSF